EARRQRRKLPLAAREQVRRPLETVLLQTELEQERARAALEPRAAGRRPALDELLLAAEDAGHPVEVAAELAELGGDGVQVAVGLVEVRPRRTHRLERRPLVALDLLRQVGDDEPAPLGRLAPVGLLEPREDPHHRRLAAAVRADHAEAT